MADTPMNEPSLMSASDDLTMAEIRIGSASFTVRFSPLRDLTDSTLPSTLVISPRTRTGGACCAHAADADIISETAAKPSARRVIGLHRHSSLKIAAGLAGAFAEIKSALAPKNPGAASDIPFYLRRSASTSARNCGVTSGRTPNQS